MRTGMDLSMKLTINKKNKGLLISCGLLMLSACSSTNTVSTYEPTHRQQSSYRPLFIQNYIDSMADSLIVNDQQRKIKRGKIAVGTIGMIDTLTLSNNNTHPLAQLGLKLQEGLMTSLLNRGYKVVEYRRTKNIVVRGDQDQMLSRELADLRAERELNYYLTGTIAYQENGAAISLRIIDLANDEVAAATTKFIPIDVFWQHRQMTEYNGMLYRDSSQGAN